MTISIRQIVQEMSAEKLRLALTIFAVAWATLCISTMLSVGEGVRLGMLKVAHNGNGNLIYITAGRASIDSGQVQLGQQLKLTMQDVHSLQALPQVTLALPTARWSSTVKYHTQTSWQQPIAVTANYQKATGLKLMPGGRWLNPFDATQQRRAIVLGYDVAARLFNPPSKFDWFKPLTLKTNPVGKSVKIGDIEFVVVGVLQKNNAQIESGSSINYSSFLPLSTWQSYNKNSPITAINILPAPTANRAKLVKTMEQVLAINHGTSINDTQAFQSQDMLKQQKSMSQFLLGLQSFLGIIGFITLAVAGVGIANVMYAMVKRSTKDIGVRMAVGATPSAIRWHYIVQSLVTMSIGGAIGLAMTYLFIQLISSINLSGNQLYDQLGNPIPVLSFSVLAVVILSLVLVGIMAAWLPAHRASKITPQQALQSE
ncbi:ABC transporter permease [Vibrio sp. S4M6]|uniref:ABC transporter permease n=1 Tax=Vibrio sinus TaxID=2946865 RepID=UPI002029EF29|nr:ABC transporter permease [Vibrio sinus]MCL9781637.1 ABC transporter permease [Vibrio sinus]